MAASAPLATPATPNNPAAEDACRDAAAGMANRIQSRLGLRRSEGDRVGWLGVSCPNVRAAVWLMRALVVSNALVGFGLLLYGADKLGLTVRRVEHMTFGQALMIGIIQCCAVIPGASGIGVTITVGRVMGYERPDAVRFALLLTIPILAATAGYKAWLLFHAGIAVDFAQGGLALGLAAALSFVAIAFLTYWVRRAGFAPFVLYRVVLGVYLLYLFYVAGGPGC